MSTFKDNLRTARLLKGMTQAEVAEKIGIAKSSYSLYESGKRTPNVIMIKKIARALDANADKLLGIPGDDEDQILRLTADDTALLLMYKDLNQDGKKKVREYVSDILDRYKNV